ncbi:dihydroorotase family protein [Candidatus Cloacimonadota bacterium]
MKLIRNAKILVGPENNLEFRNIYFTDKIIKITPVDILEKFDKELDLAGKLLIPGCIDPHVHFNDPGFTHHEDFYSGTASAAAGGVTTVIDMPCTSIPAVINKKNLHTKLSVIEDKAVVDFALWGGIRKEDFPYNNGALEDLWQEGVVGFKIYTISGMQEFQALSYEQIRHVFKEFPGYLYAFHAEDAEIIENDLKKFSEEQLASWHNFTKIRSIKAEYEAVQKIINLVENNKVHFVHISSQKAARLIIDNKQDKDLSLETCPHYLQFTAHNFSSLKGKLKTTPPVKFQEDKEFLRKAVIEGKIDFIATDHAGCDYNTEKDLIDFYQIYSGIPGTQFIIPYLFSELYLKENVPLKRMIQITSENQAIRYGLFPGKGSLLEGTDADFTVIDLDKKYTVDEQDLLSLGKYSPFHNMVLDCSVSYTIVRGETVFDSSAGITASPGFGKWIKRK